MNSPYPLEPTGEHSSHASHNELARTYRAPTMHCVSCGMLLEGLEDDLPGVTKVEADLKRQQVIIHYQPSRITEAAILAAAQAVGYELFSIE